MFMIMFAILQVSWNAFKLSPIFHLWDHFPIGDDPIPYSKYSRMLVHLYLYIFISFHIQIYRGLFSGVDLEEHAPGYRLWCWEMRFPNWYLSWRFPRYLTSLSFQHDTVKTHAYKGQRRGRRGDGNGAWINQSWSLVNLILYPTDDHLKMFSSPAFNPLLILLSPGNISTLEPDLNFKEIVETCTVAVVNVWSVWILCFKCLKIRSDGPNVQC